MLAGRRRTKGGRGTSKAAGAEAEIERQGAQENERRPSHKGAGDQRAVEGGSQLVARENGRPRNNGEREQRAAETQPTAQGNKGRRVSGAQENKGRQRDKQGCGGRGGN